MNSRLLLGAFILSMLVGCDQSRIYETSIKLDEQLWIYDSVSRFNFEISQSQQLYNLLVNVQYGNDYAYRNLYMKYVLYDSTGTELSSSLLNTKLFSDKLGQPTGSSAIGDLYELQVPILTEYNFPNRGKYSISLQQYMRVDSLQSISAIGLRVEQNDIGE